MAATVRGSDDSKDGKTGRLVVRILVTVLEVAIRTAGYVYAMGKIGTWTTVGGRVSYSVQKISQLIAFFP